jgi:glycosyltransferase involved in cell wall biosynthesis
MKIGIIGTRGIPNQYGGFEQFAEHFSTRMAERGHEVIVYTSHKHSYTAATYKNVRLVRCYDPEKVLGTVGQFIYDFNCIRDSRGQGFDVILQLGYTSSTIWSWLFPKSAILVTNMDGLEWSRAKYNKLTQYFLTHAEKWGVMYSDYLVADSRGIQDYLKGKFNADAVLVTYGAELFNATGEETGVMGRYSLKSNEYDLLIARFEPENNIETVLNAYRDFGSRKLVLVGNYDNTSFGRRMYATYSKHSHICFAGPIFDTTALNELRHHSRIYLHGHSAGGTNPSLLEAMGCGALICAHDNIFNRYVLGSDAYYFGDADSLRALLAKKLLKESHETFLANNKRKIQHDHNWDVITDTIESYFNRWKYGEACQQVLYTI